MSKRKRIISGLAITVICGGIYLLVANEEKSLEEPISRGQAQRAIASVQPQEKVTHLIRAVSAVISPTRLFAEREIPRLEPQGNGESELKNKFSKDALVNAKLLSVHETQPDSNGKFTRIRLMEAPLKYPYIRVEEQIQLDYEHGTEQALQHKEMVADHVYVSLKPGASRDTLERIIRNFNGKIIKSMMARNAHLVAFEGRDPAEFQRVLDYLNSQKQIGYAEPDYVAKIF